MRKLAYRQAGIGCQQLKAVLHVDELPLDGSVVAAKVVEWGIQLLRAHTRMHISQDLQAHEL